MALAIVNSASYTNGDTAATSHNVTLPSSIVAGNLLLLFCGINGTPTVTDPTGWTVTLSATNTDTWRIYSRIADGSEGATVTVGLSASNRMGCAAYQISGNQNGTSSSEIAISSASNANTANPDPPSLTPSWGSAANIWIAVCFSADSNSNLSSYPTNYSTEQVNGKNGTGAGGGGTGATIAARALTATSEDPGTFAWDSAKQRSAYTLAVRPAAVATDPVTPRDFPNPVTPARGISLRSHLNPVALNLIGQDKFFGAPGQGPVYDYPNPKAPLRGIELRNWINTQIPPTVTFPAVSVFWTYSQPARPVTQTWLNTFIPPAAASPIVSVIWSSPARAGQAPQFWALNLQETTLSPAAAVPFKWQEWRAPGPKAGGERSWAVNLLLTTLAPTPTVPADCGHLYPSVSAAGQSTASVSASGASRGTVSKGGSLKSEIPC